MSGEKTDPVSCKEAAWQAASGRIETVRAGALADRDAIEDTDQWKREETSYLEQIIAGVTSATPGDRIAARAELVRRSDVTSIGRSGGKRYTP